MKKILFALLIITAHSSYGQVKKSEEKPQTQIEAFSNKAGSLIKKEYINLGDIDGVKFQVLILTDVITNVSSKGLRLDYNTGGTYSTESIAFLDADELDGLLKSLNYCVNSIINTPPPANDVEYNFQAKSGFTAGVFNYNNNWEGYIKLEKYDGRTQVDFSADKIQKVIDLVVMAKTKM